MHNNQLFLKIIIGEHAIFFFFNIEKDTYLLRCSLKNNTDKNDYSHIDNINIHDNNCIQYNDFLFECKRSEKYSMIIFFKRLFWNNHVPSHSRYFSLYNHFNSDESILEFSLKEINYKLKNIKLGNNLIVYNKTAKLSEGHLDIKTDIELFLSEYLDILKNIF